jgi:hypothetical protein
VNARDQFWINGLVGCMGQRSGQKGGVHIVHTFAFGPDRTGTGLAWIGDVFREFPVFAGVGMRFESHLGHVFPLVRGGFAFNVCTFDPPRVPLTPAAVGAWRRGGL